MVLAVFPGGFGSFILCKYYTKAGCFSAKLIGELKKNMGRVHLVYHLHHDGGKFRQTARHETGIGFGFVVEPRFVCQARLAPNGFRQNDQSENE
jgi:hypothetical protein